MSFTLNRNIGHRGELRLSRRLSLPTPRTCPQCLAQVATPTLLRGPPQLAASFIPLPRQTPQPPPRRPNRETLNQLPSRGSTKPRRAIKPTKIRDVKFLPPQPTFSTPGQIVTSSVIVRLSRISKTLLCKGK